MVISLNKSAEVALKKTQPAVIRRQAASLFQLFFSLLALFIIACGVQERDTSPSPGDNELTEAGEKEESQLTGPCHQLYYYSEQTACQIKAVPIEFEPELAAGMTTSDLETFTATVRQGLAKLNPCFQTGLKKIVFVLRTADRSSSYGGGVITVLVDFFDIEYGLHHPEDLVTPMQWISLTVHELGHHVYAAQCDEDYFPVEERFRNICWFEDNSRKTDPADATFCFMSYQRPSEDFARHFGQYVSFGSDFKYRYPDDDPAEVPKYKHLKERLFGDREFLSEICQATSRGLSCNPNPNYPWVFSEQPLPQ